MTLLCSKRHYYWYDVILFKMPVQGTCRFFCYEYQNFVGILECRSLQFTNKIYTASLMIFATQDLILYSKEYLDQLLGSNLELRILSFDQYFTIFLFFPEDRQ